MHIVRNVGSPNTAIDQNGRHVFREEKIYVPELNYFVPTAPYDQHFVFDTHSKKKGQACYLCTCGSIAVIVGNVVYKNDASPEGVLFVCWNHATYGRHSDGSS